MSKLDRFSVVQGVLVAWLLVLPSFALNAYLTRDGRESSLSFWLIVVAFLGFAMGAGVAAWIQSLRTPYTHGIVAAVIAWALPQLLFIVLDLDDDGTNWLSVAAFGTFVVFAGLLGGVLGLRLRSRGVLPSIVREQEES